MGIPIFEIEQWSLSTIAEYKALNYLSPFTDHAQAYRDGLLLQFTYNQNVKQKKDMKIATDFLPYLDSNPKWLEHPLVNRAKVLLNNAKSPEMLANVIKEILDEIAIESKKENPDTYLIVRLGELIQKHKVA